MANAKLANPNAALAHSTFQVERTYPHPPERVFRAYSEEDLVRQWRVEDENCQVHEFHFDFRVDGAELSRFTFAGGPEMRLDAQFQNIVPNERIVFSYRMAIGEMPLSVSLASIELSPANASGTRVLHTEYGLYFDGTDGGPHRKEGCQLLMEKLAAALEKLL